MFRAVKGQHPGEKLDLVAEHFQGDRARQEQWVEEYATPQWQVKGHRTRGGKPDDCGEVRRHRLVGELEVNIGDAQARLIDDEQRGARFGGKRYRPRPLGDAPVLDPGKQPGIKSQRQREREQEVTQCSARFHAAGCAIGLTPRQVRMRMMVAPRRDPPEVVAAVPGGVLLAGAHFHVQHQRRWGRNSVG